MLFLHFELLVWPDLSTPVLNYWNEYASQPFETKGLERDDMNSHRHDVKANRKDIDDPESNLPGITSCSHTSDVNNQPDQDGIRPFEIRSPGRVSCCRSPDLIRPLEKRDQFKEGGTVELLLVPD